MITENKIANLTLYKKDNVKVATLIDIGIGKKITTIRKERKMSRAFLADKIGITHQQLQKYENGLNRISASRLYDLAKFLGVSVMVFYPEDF